jgi:adenylate cyclase
MGDSTATEATIHDIRNLTCWLLVADILDSTQLLQKLPPDEAPRVTGRWLAACKKILDQHHGTINKFLGDGFLAYWTTNGQAANSVAEALKALKQLQEQGKGTPLFRLVLHYGQVSAGGAASMGEESLLGPEVSFAFRAEKLAASLGSSRLLTEPAQNQLQSLLPATSEGRHRVAGFSGEFLFFSF